jgi:hypothetical protein
MMFLFFDRDLAGFSQIYPDKVGGGLALICWTEGNVVPSIRTAGTEFCLHSADFFRFQGAGKTYGNVFRSKKLWGSGL